MMLGLGAYPFETDPKPGLGPTKSAPVESGTVRKSPSLQNGDRKNSTHRYNVFIVAPVTCLL